MTTRALHLEKDTMTLCARFSSFFKFYKGKGSLYDWWIWTWRKWPFHLCCSTLRMFGTFFCCRKRCLTKQVLSLKDKISLKIFKVLKAEWRSLEYLGSYNWNFMVQLSKTSNRARLVYSKIRRKNCEIEGLVKFSLCTLFFHKMFLFPAS